jgi:hypothetical protein
MSDTQGKESHSKSLESARERMRQRRRLVIQTLAVAGALDLTAWQAQAHGNRSTSPCTGGMIADDYVFTRQQTLSPTSAETQLLSQYQNKLASLASANSDAPNTPEYQAIAMQMQTMEHRLELTPMSRSAIYLIKANNSAAATAVIEGQGDPIVVLNNYLWSMLDIAHMDEPNGLLETGAHTGVFESLAQSAMDYIDNRLPERLSASNDSDWKMAVKVREAEVLYNIAANSMPYSGQVSPGLSKLALQAAKKELAIRKELNQSLEMGRSNWILGELSLHVGDMDSAKGHLTTALDLATQSDDQPTIAWTKVYLAKVLAQSDPSAATRLRHEGLDLAQSLKDKGFKDMPYLIGIGEADAQK